MIKVCKNTHKYAKRMKNERLDGGQGFLKGIFCAKKDLLNPIICDRIDTV